MVIVGSLSGGTGAGLLPYLFRQARRGDPQNWQRPIVLIAVLPWFNPEEVREKKITWNDVCLNASFGVRALFRVMRALRAKAVPDPPGSAWTRCVFTGPDLDVTSSQGPYDPKTRVREGSVAPVMRSLVLTLPRLVAEPNAQIARPPFEFGAIQIQTAFYTPDTDKPGRMELSVDEAANAYAALRARTLADEPWQNASWAPGRITRIGGLGRTLGGSLVLSVSMSVKDKDLRQHFFEGFSSSLKKYSDLHLDRITNGEFSVTKASELHSIIQNVDSEATKEDRSSLAIKGDLKNLSPEEAKIKGKESADIIFKILQRDASRCFGENPTGAAKRMKRLTVKSRRLLPSSSDVIGDAGIFPDFCPFSIIDETAESNSLSNKYATEARLGTVLQSRSYATLLSLSHVLADRIEAYEGEPSADTKLSHLILLWRTALHGKLERKPLADRRKNEANLTESMQLDFPEPVLFSVNGIALGFSSADVGFVPHADWLEDGVRPSSNGASLQSLASLRSALGDDNKTEDLQLLRAFALHQLASRGLDEADAPPWARLLIRTARGDLGAPLEAVSTDGFPLWLRLDSDIQRIFVPLKVDHAKLKRVLAASRQMATFLPTADLAQGVLALRFDPFGIDSSEVCQFEELDGTRCVLRVNHEALDNAARAVPDGRDDQRGN